MASPGYNELTKHSAIKPSMAVPRYTLYQEDEYVPIDPGKDKEAWQVHLPHLTMEKCMQQQYSRFQWATSSICDAGINDEMLECKHCFIWKKVQLQTNFNR